MRQLIALVSMKGHYLTITLNCLPKCLLNRMPNAGLMCCVALRLGSIREMTSSLHNQMTIHIDLNANALFEQNSDNTQLSLRT